MTYRQMQQEAAKLGLKFIGVKKEDLAAAIAEAKANKSYNKSEAIREMLAAGMYRKDIAAVLGVRYQMVRNVELRMKATVA